MYLPYKKSNRKRARENRKIMTKAEKRIWFEILCHKPKGYKFIRQKMLDSFIIDFFSQRLLLAIEIDGGYHFTLKQRLYDQQRTEKLEAMGVKVIRYTNHIVFYDIISVYEDLLQEIKKREYTLNI